MIISGYLIKLPYLVAWYIANALKKKNSVSFYVGSLHDYYLIENVLPHIKTPYQLVAKNFKVAKILRDKGLSTSVWPAFPNILIMPRHSFHKFPLKIIRKVGMRHGPYHFKKMINASKYNAFDLFLFTSEHEVAQAEQKGIYCGVPGGYPRLDAFKDQKTINKSQSIKNQSAFDNDKVTLLFTATWDRSGLSAVHKWVDQINELKEKYNVFVSLHPMMSKKYYKKIAEIKEIHLVSSYNLPAYMLASDFLVSDTSSVIAEYCTLNKGVITFKLNAKGRLTNEISEMISDISFQIDDVRELDRAVKHYSDNPDFKKINREKWSRVFFDDISISHGEKAAQYINSFIERFN